MGAIGALANAVNDALAPFGIVAQRAPFSPESLRGLLRSSLRAEASARSTA
jgi:carbon-monoxide dehydrogenase large subunit